jgi:hypothetical protein
MYLGTAYLNSISFYKLYIDLEFPLLSGTTQKTNVKMSKVQGKRSLNGLIQENEIAKKRKIETHLATDQTPAQERGFLVQNLLETPDDEDRFLVPVSKLSEISDDEGRFVDPVSNLSETPLAPDDEALDTPENIPTFEGNQAAVMNQNTSTNDNFQR